MCAERKQNNKQITKNVCPLCIGINNKHQTNANNTLHYPKNTYVYMYAHIHTYTNIAAQHKHTQKQKPANKKCMCTYTSMPEPGTTTQQTQPTQETDNKFNNTYMCIYTCIQKHS